MHRTPMNVAHIRIVKFRFHVICAFHTVMGEKNRSESYLCTENQINTTFTCSVYIAVKKQAFNTRSRAKLNIILKKCQLHDEKIHDDDDGLTTLNLGSDSERETRDERWVKGFHSAISLLSSAAQHDLSSLLNVDRRLTILT